jgi:thiosulfate/3-mercaptopyruvate sulfurtransferase
MTNVNASFSSVDPSQESPWIISASWLHHHLDHPQVVIIDCRFSLADASLGRKQYEASHIPGAYYLDLNQDLSGPIGQHGGRHPLPDPTALATKLAAIGVRSQNGQDPTLVVAYDDSQFAFAARLWWLLRYLGHDRVAVLNGGFGGWQAAGYAVTTALSQPKPGKFIPRLRRDWTVDVEGVKAREGSPAVALVDSREGDRYRGEREPIDPVAGHIPGAVNYPWQEVADAQGRLYSAQVQQQRWAALQSAQEIVVYCGSGVTACVNLLSLEIAGIDKGKLYAGSWSDWCSYL